MKNIIGLTGYYCSGKSTVEKILLDKYGFFVVDLDKVGHMVLGEKSKELASIFGDIILNENGEVNRKVLGSIVFNDGSKLKLLNNFVHPLIMNKVMALINGEHDNICIDGALLFEIGLYEYCSKIIVVDAFLLIRILRGMARDKRSFIEILKILSKQKLTYFLRKYKNDPKIFHVNNNFSRKTLKSKLQKILT